MMFQKTLFVLLFVLFNCQHLTLSKEHHDHALKGNKRAHEAPSSRHKQIKYKSCPPRSCDIICPIEVYLQPCGINPGGPIITLPTFGVPLESSTQNNTGEFSTSPSPNGNSPTPNQKNQTGPIGPQVANAVNQVFPAISSIVGNNSGQQERHHLRHRKTHIQLKKLVLSNRNGKKAYKFRQAPQSCYVKCTNFEHVLEPSVVHEDPGIIYNHEQPPEGDDNEVDEADDEEPYVEGEDSPIEVTREPGSQSGRVVDFIGFDDFGPDGLPARQFSNEAEGKKKSGKKN